MNILYISFPSLNGTNGSSTHVREVINNLSHNNNVTVISPYKRKPNVERNVSLIKGRYVNIPLLRAFTFSIYTLFICVVHFFNHKYDVIYERDHFFGTAANLSYIYSIPIIMEINGICNETERLPHSINPILEKFLSNRYNRSNHIITVTNNLKKHLIEEYAIKADKISVIENGVNTDLFVSMDMNYCKKKMNLDLTVNYVCFVGHLAYWQGVEYIIKASTIVLKECPNTKFLIVGDGPQFNQLKKMTERLSVQNKFIFTKKVKYENVPYYINASTVCVAPFIKKRNEEIGLSALKIYEYLSCGKPVIASNIEGTNDTIVDSKGGYVIPPENENELAKYITYLIKNPSICNKLGKTGATYVRNRFSWNQVAKKIEQIYSNMTVYIKDERFET